MLKVNNKNTRTKPIASLNFFSESDQIPDLEIEDLQKFFVEKSGDPRPVNIVF